MSTEITVKAGTMPGRITEVVVAKGATVKAILAAASLDATGYEIKVDGATATEATTINVSGKLVLLTKKVKGNAGMENVIKIGTMPGRISEVVIEPGTTVKQAAALAGLSIDGFEAKVNGNTVELSAIVPNDATVIFAKKVKGNSGVIKIGVMPGRINEYALPNTATIKEALAAAGLSADGFEVKLDGVVVTDFSKPIGNSNLLLLSKKVKGNSGVIKVGVMPGRINEYALPATATVADALAAAGLNADGFEVKVDGVVVTNFSQALGNANLVLLSKKVKGNSGVIKVGVMPGRINEYALPATATVKDALDAAGLNADGFEVKVDGVVVTNFSQALGNANLLLLSKKVKGNK